MDKKKEDKEVDAKKTVGWYIMRTLFMILAIGIGLTAIDLFSGHISKTTQWSGMKWMPYVFAGLGLLFVVFRMVSSLQVEKNILAKSTAGLVAKAFTFLLRLAVVVCGFTFAYFLVDFFAEQNAAYMPFTVKALVSSLIMGAVLSLIAVVVGGMKEKEEIAGFIKAACSFSYAIVFISIFTTGYHYISPMFFDPTEEEIVAKQNIDPDTYKSFSLEEKRDPKTANKLRTMTPEDVPHVLEKERKDREAILNAIEPIIIGFSENASAHENQPNSYRRQAQKNYSITMVSPPTTYQSVVRSGDPIHITWKTDAPGYMQIHWTNGGENWMYVGKVITSVGFYDWHPKIPGGTDIIVRIGIYDSSSSKWLAEDSANMYVQSVVYMP